MGLSNNGRDLLVIKEGWRSSYVQRIEDTNRDLSDNSRLLDVLSLDPFSLWLHKQNQGLLTEGWAHLMAPMAVTSFLLTSSSYSHECEVRNYLPPAPAIGYLLHLRFTSSILLVVDLWCLWFQGSLMAQLKTHGLLVIDQTL